MDAYRYLSFSSAGTKGVAYVGVLDALEEHLGAEHEAWRTQVRGVSGCSSGSIVGLMFVLGLSRKKRHELLSTYDIRHVLRDPDLAMLWHQYGITEGGMREIAQEVLSQGGLSVHSTFADVRRLLRVDFVCVASDLATASATYFCAARTPDVRIADAVCASCCVPIAFRPHAIDGRVYVDGCLTCNQPDVFERAATLYVTVASQAASAPDSWVAYLSALMRCACENQRETLDGGAGAAAAAVLRVDLSADPAFDVQMDERRARRTRHRGFVDAMAFLTGGRTAAACALACRLYLRACHTAHLNTDDESPPEARAAGGAASPRTGGPS